MPLGAKEGEGHSAADEQAVDLAEERLDERQLVGDLGAAQDRDEGPGGGVEDAPQDLEFLLHEEPGHRRTQVMGDPFDRGVAPVSGGEGIVDVDVAEPRQRPGEARVVRLLLGVEAEVFQEEQAARREGSRRLLHRGADAVGGERHPLAEERPQAPGDGTERVLRVGLPLRAPEVGGEDHPGPPPASEGDRGEDGPDARVLHHLAVAAQGHVEVHAEEDPGAAQLDVLDGALGHVGEASTSGAPPAPGPRATGPGTGRGPGRGRSTPTRCRTTRGP